MRFLKIGSVKGTHGLDGVIKVAMNTDNLSLLDNLEYLMMGKNRKVLFSGKVEYIEPMNEYYLVKIENVNDLDTAIKYKGYEILIPESLLPAEEDDEVYWFKIEGAEVVDTDEIKIGTLIDYLESGSADVFRIKGVDEKYYLISNNREHVLKIDVEKKKVFVNRDGLIDEEL